jgi:pimeloyl-ACP methyl ester carboxylesterase
VKAHCLLSILLAVTSIGCSTSLQHYTPAVPSAYYLHDGVKIHFKQVGTGRPVIFLHGFGTSLDTWRFVVETFQDDYRLVLLDLKGHGLSDRPRDEMYAAQDQARVVRGLIDYLGLENVVIVGHSFGSVVGLAAALDAQRDGSSGVIAALFLIAGSVDAENVPFVLACCTLFWHSSAWANICLFSDPLMLKHATKIAGYRILSSIVYPLSIHPGTDYALIKTAEQLVPVDISAPKKRAVRCDPVINI